MSRTRFHHRWIAATTAAGLALLAPLLVSPAPAAAAGFCALTGMDKFVWDGGGGTSRWDNPANWNQNKVPGFTTTAEDDYVCIAMNAAVILDTGFEGAEVNLLAIDLAPGSSLYMGSGSKMFLEGNKTSQASVVRAGATVHQLGSTIGGTGKLNVSGTLNWTSLADGGATQTTRECDQTELGCSGAAAVAGITNIAAGGKLNIADRGVNLFDRRIITNSGTVTLTGDGYIAADFGTAFTNTAAGVVKFTGPRGYFQGRQRYGITKRNAFSNAGTIEKSGTGTTVVDAAYSEPNGTGTIVILAGSFSIFTPATSAATTNRATVKQGARFGTGGCAAGADTCTAPESTSADKQTASVALPAIGTTSATVTVAELPGEKTAAMRTAPTLVETPNAQSSTSAPMRFTFVLDATLVKAGETAAGLAQNIVVERKGTGDAAYATVPSCGATGNPTVLVPSCVDRAQSAAATSGAGGDVVIIVKTTQNSRWVAR